MSDKIKLLTDCHDPRWDAFVKNHEFGTIYHTSSWMKLVQKTYGHTPIYIVIENDQGKIKAGLPIFMIRSKITGNRLSTVPCAQSCDPLVSVEHDLKILLSRVKKIQEEKGFDYFELKTKEEFPFSATIDAPPSNQYSTYLLNIDGPMPEVMKTFHKNHIKRGINKSLRSRLTKVCVTEESHLRSFYGLYSGMRKKYGLLPQPYSFFKNMWLIFQPHGNIEVLLAVHKGVAVSSILLLKYKNTVTYEYGASLSNRLSLRPSHFLLWSAINGGHSEGYKFFDFGRVTKTNKGLTDFKSRWGTYKHGFSYYYTPDTKNFSALRNSTKPKEIMHSIVRISPKTANDYLGKLLYRHLL